MTLKTLLEMYGIRNEDEKVDLILAIICTHLHDVLGIQGADLERCVLDHDLPGFIRAHWTKYLDPAWYINLEASCLNLLYDAVKATDEPQKTE